MWKVVPLNEIEVLSKYAVVNTNGKGLPTYINKPMGEQGNFKVPEMGLITVLRRYTGTYTDYFLVEYKGIENKDKVDVWIDGNNHFAVWVEDEKPEPEPIVEFEELIRIGRYFLGRYI